MKLTKAQMIEKISNRNGFSKKKSAELVESLLTIMKNTLASGEDILITGFGKFCVKDKKQRKGRNPATGEGMMIRSRRIVTFRCSGILWDMINSDPN